MDTNIFKFLIPLITSKTNSFYMKMAHYYIAYTKNICYKYKANLRSSVTIFLILNGFFCFILPLILCYNSSGK